jgi:hypothetical protein
MKIAYSDISVCIATVGRPSLFDLLDDLRYISSGLLEYHICISPNPEEKVISRLSEDPLITLHISNIANQVIQRHIALQSVRRPLTLLLDDDIGIDKESLDIIVHTYHQLPAKSILGPTLCRSDRSGFFNPKPSPNSILSLSSISYWIKTRILGCSSKSTLSDHSYGQLSIAGIPIGFPKLNASRSSQVHKVDYLPGCFMLLDTSGAMINGYYPFTKGRCSLEDIFHCSYLSKNYGYQAFTSSVAYVICDCPEQDQADLILLKNLVCSFRRQLYFNKLYDYSKLRLIIFYSAYLSLLALRVLIYFGLRSLKIN